MSLIKEALSLKEIHRIEELKGKVEKIENFLKKRDKETKRKIKPGEISEFKRESATKYKS
ncbi:hypothetical protein DRZ78_04425 [Candidatus Aerophobetes bacterium]|uniref:Uncharacterized protein n=1 Tax=Aerophobetes bacterium TaxID=2030807 RepID=A0A662D2T3_UNCAE|nr:MAG: hypothetical protein DRZ78_04425 [Candidatus Aerophobetes bacterium]